MSLFKNLPTLNIGEPLTPHDIADIHITARDRIRLEQAMDCYALALANQNSDGITKLSLRFLGELETRTGILIPPSANIGYWPGFDIERTTIQSKRLTALIRTLKPHLSPAALLVTPTVESDRAQMEREVSTRLVVGRQYTLPITASQHNVMAAIAWISQFQFP